MSWKNKLFLKGLDEEDLFHKQYDEGKSIAAWEMLYRCERDTRNIPQWVFDYLFDCADRLAEIEDVGKNGPRVIIDTLRLNNLRNAFDDEDKGQDLLTLQDYVYERYADLKTSDQADEEIYALIADEMSNGIAEDANVRSILLKRSGVTDFTIKSWISKVKKFRQAMQDEEP